MRSVRILVLVAALVAALGALSGASAAVTYYTNEATYLADLASLSTTNIFEGFEGSAWDNTHWPANGEPNVTSQGINWTALSDSLWTINSAWTRSGTYGVFENWGVPDGIGVTPGGSYTMYGVGGWFNTWSSTTLDFYVNGAYGNTLQFDTELYDHQFFGVIDTDGLTNVRMISDDHYGADDFTIGVKSTTVVPEPATLILFGSGLLGSAFFSRRRR